MKNEKNYLNSHTQQPFGDNQLNFLQVPKRSHCTPTTLSDNMASATRIYKVMVQFCSDEFDLMQGFTCYSRRGVGCEVLPEEGSGGGARRAYTFLNFLPKILSTSNSPSESSSSSVTLLDFESLAIRREKVYKHSKRSMPVNFTQISDQKFGAKFQ